MLEVWRNRPIPPVGHLILDARYEKVRVGGIVRSCAVLTAIAIRPHDGKRSIVGTSVSLSAAEVHLRDFLRSLQARGLISCASITSDAHEGLKAALTSVYPGVPWNRYQSHLQQNAQAYVPHHNLKEQVANDIRAIFNAERRSHAQAKLAAAVEKHATSAPELARWMEANLSEAFTVFTFPEAVRKHLRTSNLCETLNKHIRR